MVTGEVGQAAGQGALIEEPVENRRFDAGSQL